MTIYVDELLKWPTKMRLFKNGSCHMWTDGNENELHDFAKSIGLKRAWFQVRRNGMLNHYDLTPNKRTLAIERGATAVNMADYLRAKRNG